VQFGKVYKGLWRGTVVAVKTMVMPANMSGAEKREKMVGMIVRTGPRPQRYTYSRQCEQVQLANQFC
jgi:hypothetical protein